ncbi:MULTISPECIES: biosynthetic peptidoglycan transglycosylase [Myroides]|uniref:biosynthetic peptidoglycan transglycosylase n=1 Tax=Myroides TaxID=76831 RepID=UPI0025753A95|nr:MULTISPECIES: biosynthetic peptidoglycan transglycosylase [Myroides]MDM1380893.1 transglycosylase domain-containing protein [Myroides marinus]MDM1388165.1 transglycosylase domain-containing protein [Myroides marinus]MDM1395368.1 transglycosylase domain-containing protein [Myroides marinus]MDM1525564.1 transglycosylase domain-containing protein [Myroides odoratimimus]
MLYKTEYELLEKKIIAFKPLMNKLITLENLDLLIQVLIIGEDRRFYKHKGYDLKAIIRVIYKRIISNKKEGGSTIEQQLVRVLTNDYSPTLKRKIKEIYLATKLSNKLKKKEIALFYLFIAYYGTNYQGLELILKKFNKTLNSVLTLDICAEIIARLKYPEPRTVSENKMKLINKRKLYILNVLKND